MRRVTKQLGEYRILAQLAKGGQSEVYLAARSGPHGFFRPVVIKAIPEDFKGKPKLEALFYQEATLSSRFSHPHVVTIHDAKRADDEHFMVMDYVSGQTVADLAQRAFAAGKGLSLDETLLIISDACRGLDYVHSFEAVEGREYSIVHCDISPQNLMVTYSGMTRVFDFGISQVIGESPAVDPELIGGKFAYMSPEQCREEELDPRSDIFSLGVILYELATGRRLFRRSSEDEVRQAIISDPIAAPSKVAAHLSEEIDEVILRALQRDREARYPTAGAMESALQRLLSARAIRRDDLREQLGAKVDELFCEEREQVASLLDEARREMASEPLTNGLSRREREAVETAELLAEELDTRTQELEQLRKKAQRATEVAGALTKQVRSLQRRQQWLTVGIFVMAMVALAVAGMAYLSHQVGLEEAGLAQAEVEE